jgi:hypothetical protein
MQEGSDRRGEGVRRDDEMQSWVNLDSEVKTIEKG